MENKLFRLSYGSMIGLELGQDIETKSFNNINELLLYLSNRIDIEFNGVYTIEYENENNKCITDESPSSLITRNIKELIMYSSFILSNENNHLTIFEWDFYDDAIEYVRDSFETSSIMYEDNGNNKIEWDL